MDSAIAKLIKDYNADKVANAIIARIDGKHVELARCAGGVWSIAEEFRAKKAAPKRRNPAAKPVEETPVVNENTDDGQ